MTTCEIDAASVLFNKRTLPLSAIVLCGGNSKRIGRSKAFLPYAGTTLIENCLKKLSAVFAEIILVCNDPDEFKHLSANVVRDLIPAKGPLVGILSGLLLAKHEQALVCPCDMPLIDEELLRELAAKSTQADLVLYGHDGIPEPLLGVYSRSCIAGLEEMVFSGNYSLNDYLASTPKVISEFQSQKSLAPHFSVDTPADYGRILSA